MMHAIEVTREAIDRQRRAEIEWQTKVLAGFTAQTVQDPKAAEKLLASVERLSMTDEAELDGSADTSSERDTRTLEEVMEHGNVEAALRHNSQRKGPGLPF